MSALLRDVLAATGYLPDGAPAEGLTFAPGNRRGAFQPDASWISPSSLTVYFKQQSTPPSESEIAQWRREIWNEGFAPLLWVVSPERIDLFNGFGKPLRDGDAATHLLRSFQNIEASLAALDAFAGRLAIETGQFWVQAPQVDRKTSVDQQLLGDLSRLEHDLVASDMGRDVAQALIGRVIFTQYLIDREIVSPKRLKTVTGHADLPSILRDRKAATELFAWLAQTFNGDMFPAAAVRTTPAGAHLKRMAEFLQAVDADSGQLSLFPYQFDIIPVELISSIYEQFAHAGETGKRSDAKATGVHYTRLPVVSLVLDEVMDDITGSETVLDLTCGSGVFLVEALRRLVHRRANGAPLSRELIRSTLHEQIFGVDLSEAAVRVAAFSLYLAALELDPDPHPAHALRFRPLIGRNLLIGDARKIESSEAGAQVLRTPTGLRTFDLIIGNPPWTFRGERGTRQRRRAIAGNVPKAPRGESLDFVLRAAEFAGDHTRFGLVLSAMPFFSRSDTGQAAAMHVLKALAPVTIVNLANLSSWLFSNAQMPAVAFFARHRRGARPDLVTIVQVPWTPTGGRTHTFEIAPSDVIRVPLAELEQQPLKLKAGAVGRRRDMQLLDHLSNVHRTMGQQLDELGSVFRDGLINGNPRNQTKSAAHLKGLELLDAKVLEPLSIPKALPRFNQRHAQWPRSRETYRAPLVIVKEFFVQGPRLTVAVSKRDLVYKHGFFAASLPGDQLPLAFALSAVLSSSIASWFYALTSSEFGIYKRKLLASDISALPIPPLDEVATSDAGRQLARLAEEFAGRELSSVEWAQIDAAAADLYRLNRFDRIVVADGLSRASWQWEDGRRHWAEPVQTRDDLSDYAQAFLEVIGTWLAARNKRHIRAEIVDLPASAALRVVRFVLEEGPGEARVDVIPANGPLTDVLSRVGARMKVPVASCLTANRELRLHSRNEIVIIKPAARRHWLQAEALRDADAVVAESFTGGNT